MKKRKPYSERSDIDKIESNWKKACGFFDRGEWSGAVMRAATACEIAANLAIREELQVKRNLEKDFVDNLLLWANGIHNKFHKLLLPICKGSKKHKKFNDIRRIVNGINKERNSIAHSGHFKNESTSKRILKESKQVIQIIVREYQSGFKLNKI
jgi:hypothetical protein